MQSELHPTFSDIFKNFGVMPESIEMQSYRSLLKRHDWSFEYSDDGMVYRNGKKQRETLSAMRATLDPDFSVWNSYAPPEYQK